MSGNIIDEFLVALGWRVDTSAARKAEQTADRVADTIESAEQRQTKASVAGAAKRRIEADREARRRTKGAAAYIDELKKRETAEKKAAAATEQSHKKAAQASEASAATVAKGAAAIITAIEGAAVGVTLAVTKIASRMEQLYYASERTHASVAKIKAYEYAASQLGSTADGASNSLEDLAKNLRSSPGYEGMLRNLGVATRQNGKLRDLTDITLDLGKALGKLPHFQALAFANALGLDEHTLIALKSGDFAKHIKDYQEMLGKAGLNSDQAAKDSAAFMNTWRRMWAAVDILFNRIGAALTAKFGGQIGRMTDFLLANADRIATAVILIGETLLRLAIRIVDLIQKFNDADPATKQFVIQIGALAAALLLLNSGPVAAILALGSAIVVLYDDYQRWREGAKDTLVPWDEWAPAIEKTLAALKALWEGFDRVAQAITGQSGLVVAFEALAVVMVAKLLAPLGRVVGLLGSLGAMTPPPWLLRLLGLGGVAVAGAAIANQNGILGTGEGSGSWHERAVRFLDPGIANRIYGQTDAGRAADASNNRTLLRRGVESLGPSSAQAHAGRNAGGGTWVDPPGRTPKDDRSLYQRVMPKVLGGKDARTSGTPPASSGSGAVKTNSNYTAENAEVLRQAAQELGTSPEDLATVISYESKFRQNVWGGKGGNYMGLIQFGGPERAMYGANDQQSFAEQMPAVVRYLKHRGFKPGMGLIDLYSTINAGRPGRYGASDGNGTVAGHVERMRVSEAGRVQRFLNSGTEQAPERLPEVASGSDPVSDAADYRAYRYELERNAKAGQVPGEEENDADRYAAWRKDRNLSAIVDKVRSVAIDTAGKVEDTLTAYPRAWMERADASMGKVGDRFDASSPWKDGKPFAATPLGISHNNSRSTSNTFNEGDRHITVNGVSDPKEAADHITKSDTRRRSDLIGNFQNSFA